MLEARTVGFCATGNTTAKMSLLQGTTLSKIIGRHGVETAQAYVDGNREGQEWLIHHCRANGVAVQRVDAYTYAQTGKITRPMMISTDSPTRSVRYAPTADGERLIVGGAGDPVGREESPSKALEELSSWARVHYPGAVQTHFWSAQDYAPADQPPYVGPILPGNEKIFVATGFNSGE